MIKNFIIYLWSLRRQFAKYFITGISGVIIDMASLLFLKEVLGWKPVTAVILNQFVLLFFVFFVNKYWSFREHSMPHKQVIRFLVLAVFNYGFAVVAMYIFNHRFGFDYRLVRLASIAMMVSWNFFLYKYWVYKTDGQPTAPILPAGRQDPPVDGAI